MLRNSNNNTHCQFARCKAKSFLLLWIDVVVVKQCSKMNSLSKKPVSIFLIPREGERKTERDWKTEGGEIEEQKYAEKEKEWGTETKRNREGTRWGGVETKREGDREREREWLR